jgi:hypothetical protein
MTRLLLCAVTVAFVVLGSEGLAAIPRDLIVLDFDDIQVFPADYVGISGTNYHGIGWPTSSQPGRDGNIGFWLIDDGSDDPEGQGLVNGFAAPDMVIEFPWSTKLIGTLAAAQGTFGNTNAIRAHGYRDNLAVGSTPWFNNLIRHQPRWFDFNLPAVDLISIEVQPSASAAAEGELWGAFRLDNFTFQYVPEPHSGLLVCFGMISLLCNHRWKRNPAR